MKKYGLYKVVWLLVLLSYLVGCSKGYPPYVLDYSAAETLSQEEYDSISTYIDQLNPEIDTDITYYEQMPETYDRFFEIGLKGVPVVMDRFKIIGKDPKEANKLYRNFSCGVNKGVYAYGNFLQYGLMGITRESTRSCTQTDSDSLHKEKCISGTDTRRYCILSYTKEQIVEIINSNKTTDKKLIALAPFGVYALPYVMAQIDQGNKDYKAYFVYIGLHLSDSEYMSIASDFYLEVPYGYESPEAEQIMAERISALLAKGNPEEFDYKAWLNENEDDLNALYKYMDEFCAEYEAKQTEE